MRIELGSGRVLGGTDENGGNVLWRVCACRIRIDGANVHAGNGGGRNYDIK